MKNSSVFKPKIPLAKKKKKLVDKIFDSFEKEQFTPRVFIDLSKAFDTVDHSILLEKLKLYGITGKNLAWIQSYLSNEKQYTEIDENSKTDPKCVTCGVPKGSILEPLFFSLFSFFYVKHLQPLKT